MRKVFLEEVVRLTKYKDILSHVYDMTKCYRNEYQLTKRLFYFRGILIAIIN